MLHFTDSYLFQCSTLDTEQKTFEGNSFRLADYPSKYPSSIPIPVGYDETLVTTVATIIHNKVGTALLKRTTGFVRHNIYSSRRLRWESSPASSTHPYAVTLNKRMLLVVSNRPTLDSTFPVCSKNANGDALSVTATDHTGTSQSETFPRSDRINSTR